MNVLTPYYQHFKKEKWRKERKYCKGEKKNIQKRVRDRQKVSRWKGWRTIQRDEIRQQLCTKRMQSEKHRNAPSETHRK